VTFLNDGNVGIWTTNPAFAILQTSGAGVGTNFLTNPKSSNFIGDSRSMAANVGGGQVFGGVYTGTSQTAFAGIRGVKANATDGNYDGQMEFFVRQNGDNDWTGDQRMVITAAGNVGIGTAGSTFQLQLSTDSAAKPTSNTWTISSDQRIKTNIQDFTDGLSTLLNIRPRTYTYNGLGGLGYDDTKTNIGIIAQELEPVAPYMIETGNGMIDGKEVSDFKSYQGHALPFIMVNAIKELHAKVEDMSSRDLHGVVLRDTDGAGCYRITVNTVGTLTTTVTQCP